MTAPDFKADQPQILELQDHWLEHRRNPPVNQTVSYRVSAPEDLLFLNLELDGSRRGHINHIPSIESTDEGRILKITKEHGYADKLSHTVYMLPENVGVIYLYPYYPVEQSREDKLPNRVINVSVENSGFVEAISDWNIRNQQELIYYNSSSRVTDEKVREIKKELLENFSLEVDRYDLAIDCGMNMGDRALDYHRILRGFLTHLVLGVTRPFRLFTKEGILDLGKRMDALPSAYGRFDSLEHEFGDFNVPVSCLSDYFER